MSSRDFESGVTQLKRGCAAVFCNCFDTRPGCSVILAITGPAPFLAYRPWRAESLSRSNRLKVDRTRKALVQ